jgi:hypothetical protein
MGAGRVTTVLLGSNRFVDCETLVAIQQTALLSVALEPLRVSFTTPDLPSVPTIRVTDNERRGDGTAVQVVATEKSVAIFWDRRPIVIATLLQVDTVSLKIDLRPIGVNLYEDAGALHIGANTFIGNAFQGCKVGIVLG